MAKDLSTITSPSSNDDDIDINKVTNSGTDSDRDDISPDNADDVDNPPSPDNTGGTPNPSDNDGGGDSTDEDDSPEGELQTLLQSFNGEDLSEEDQELKTQLLSKYKGSSFNEKGEIVDEEGQVVASMEDVMKGLDDEGTINDKGDLVDDEGNVIKTKAELAVENSVVNKLHSELDFEFLDEEGNPKVYSDDAQGFQELANDMAAHKLENFKSTFFSQNPELTEVAKHLLSGNSLDTFQKPIDYSKIEVDKLSKDEKESYIRKSLKAGGLADSRIDAMVKRIKDGNDLDAEAEEALADLTMRDKEAKKVRDAEYQKSVEEQNKLVQQHWEDVQKTVDKGQLANLNVPEKDKQAFFDYMARPVDENGNSKEMLDSEQESLEQKLAISYIRYKGFKLDDLIEAKARTKNVASLRERLKRSAKQKQTPANDANGITSGNDADVSINSLLN